MGVFPIKTKLFFREEVNMKKGIKYHSNTTIWVCFIGQNLDKPSGGHKEREATWGEVVPSKTSVRW